MISVNPKKPHIYEIDSNSLQEILHSWGEPHYRASQIWRGLYNNLWNNPDQFTTLSKSLQHRLEEAFSWYDLEPGLFLESSDGITRKTLFHLSNGNAIEAVLMRYKRRNTICISSQVGCPMGCVFCATGQMGFVRNLTSAEIVGQVLYFARDLNSSNERITNVVVMGMGEPFSNYESTMSAIRCLNQPDGFNLGARRFTISTVGLIPGIYRFMSEDKQINLAISLHAADDDLRSSLLPINRKYPIKDLISVCYEYVRKSNRRISFEWALIRDVNDNDEQARKLAQLLKPFTVKGSSMCHVNLIQLNPTQIYSGNSSTTQQTRSFHSALEYHGIPCTIRTRHGIDIQAGCGQLVVQGNQHHKC